MGRDELRKIVGELDWFHAIDFGDFASAGRFPQGSPQNETLFGAMDLLSGIDLSGQACLDIGTSDGLLAFGMKTMGASRVCASDSYDLESFRLAREILNLDIEYFPGIQIKDMVELFNETPFDLIACAGIIYHMLNPTSAFLNARKIIKSGGLFILETAYAKSNDAIMVLNSESKNAMPEIHTYWIPSQKAVEGLLKLACFDILGVRVLNEPNRITYLAKAVSPNEISNPSRMLRNIHRVDFCDFDFQLRQLDLDKTPHSQISFEINHFERTIEPKKYKPTFPFHPQRKQAGLGRSRWFGKTGNRPA